MRNTLLLSLLVIGTGLNAWAHPKDSDDLYYTPGESVLSVTRPINLYPNTDKMYFAMDGSMSPAQPSGKHCYIKVKQASTLDRVIRPGTTFIIKAATRSSDNRYLEITGSATVTSFGCSSGYREPDVTIGDFRKMIGNHLSLRLANPSESGMMPLSSDEELM